MKRKRRLLALVLLGCCSAHTGRAVLDLTDNGISDIYEQAYGLTGSDGASSDLDGDGLTLQQEYILGTDPTVPDQAPVLQEALSISPFSGTLNYAFMAHAGLRYRVDYTDDLSSGEWIPGMVVPGDGTILSFVDSVTNDARFYRTAALGPAPDEDRDLLDSREETLAGTDSGFSDSDGDGLPDGYEAVMPGFDPAVAESHVLAPIDYFENFESLENGLLHGQDGWTVSTDRQALVQPGTPCTGLKGLQFTALREPVRAEKHFDGAALSTVWIDLYLLPGETVEEPAVLGTLAATAVCFSETGHLKAFDGAAQTWVEDSFPAGINALEWQRLTFRLDYPNQQWLVYLNGNLVNPAPGGVPTYFGFSNPSPYFYRLAFDVTGNGNELYIDDVSVSTAPPPGLDLTL